jgi:hypothetical protein
MPAGATLPSRREGRRRAGGRGWETQQQDEEEEEQTQDQEDEDEEDDDNTDDDVAEGMAEVAKAERARRVAQERLAQLHDAVRCALAGDERHHGNDATGGEDGGTGAVQAAALLAGWEATTRTRPTEGASRPVYDTFFVSPCGQRFKSSVAVLRHLGLVVTPAGAAKASSTAEERRVAQERLAQLRDTVRRSLAADDRRRDNDGSTSDHQDDADAARAAALLRGWEATTRTRSTVVMTWPIRTWSLNNERVTVNRTAARGRPRAHRGPFMTPCS